MERHARSALQIGLTAAALTAGLTVASPVCAVAIAGIGVNLAASLVERLSNRTVERLLSENGFLNHDLQWAMRKAFGRAAAYLETEWWKTNDGRALKGTDLEPQIDGLFTALKRGADAILTDDRLKPMIADAEAMRLFRSDEATRRQAVGAALADIARGDDRRVVRFLEDRLVRDLSLFFTDVLRTDKTENNRAWRAFQMVSLNALQDSQALLLASQTEMIARIDKWADDLANAGPPEKREPTGEAALTKLYDDLVDVIARESRQTREAVDAAVKTIVHQLDRLEGKIDLVLDILGERPVAPPPNTIWRVPHRPLADFTGRAAELRALEGGATRSRHALVIQAIQGMGGVGKTRLVAHHAHRQGDDYDLVWWIVADDPATLASDYAALAAELRLPEAAGSDQPAQIAAVRRRLERGQEHWLLIVDNAEHPNDLDAYLPTRGNGQVVITSRPRIWDPHAETIDLDVFSIDEGARFLLDRTKRTGAAEEAAARDLATEMDGLPLGLEIAASFVVANKRSLAFVLSLFKENPPARIGVDESDRSKETIRTVWEATFNRLRATSEAAAAFVNLCAFLAPDGIPIDLLLPHARVLPPILADALSDAATAITTIGLAHQYGLIDIVDDKNVAMHRLVQLAARVRLLSDDQAEGWAADAARIVNAAIDGDPQDARTWPLHRRLLAHGIAAAGHAEQLGIALQDASRVLNETGVYLAELAEYDQARAHFERALAIDRAAFGEEHPNVARGLNNLALVLEAQGDLATAKTHYERALAIDRAAFGEEHPNRGARAQQPGPGARSPGRPRHRQDPLRAGAGNRPRRLRRGAPNRGARAQQPGRGAASPGRPRHRQDPLRAGARHQSTIQRTIR